VHDGVSVTPAEGLPEKDPAPAAGAVPGTVRPGTACPGTAEG